MAIRTDLVARKESAKERKTKFLAYSRSKESRRSHISFNNEFEARVHSLVEKQWKKSKEETSMKVVGCDIEFLRAHLESLFHESMNWDDYGYRVIC